MKITEKSIKALAQLNKWEKGNYHYSLYHIHDMEMYSDFSECDSLDMVVSEEYIESETTDFKAFANAKDGSEFALWLDASNEGEAPVVYLDSDGELILIALSMEEFVCKIAHGYGFYLSVDSTSWCKELNYDELVEFSEGSVESEEEMKALVEKELEKFSSSVAKSFNCTEDNNEEAEELLREKLAEMALC